MLLPLLFTRCRWCVAVAVGHQVLPVLLLMVTRWRQRFAAVGHQVAPVCHRCWPSIGAGVLFLLVTGCR